MFRPQGASCVGGGGEINVPMTGIKMIIFRFTLDPSGAPYKDSPYRGRGGNLNISDFLGIFKKLNQAIPVS